MKISYKWWLPQKLNLILATCGRVKVHFESPNALLKLTIVVCHIWYSVQLLLHKVGLYISTHGR